MWNSPRSFESTGTTQCSPSEFHLGFWADEVATRTKQWAWKKWLSTLMNQRYYMINHMRQAIIVLPQNGYIWSDCFKFRTHGCSSMMKVTSVLAENFRAQANHSDTSFESKIHGDFPWNYTFKNLLILISVFGWVFWDFMVDFAVADVLQITWKNHPCRFPSAAPRAREIYDEVAKLSKIPGCHRRRAPMFFGGKKPHLKWTCMNLGLSHHLFWGILDFIH